MYTGSHYLGKYSGNKGYNLGQNQQISKQKSIYSQKQEQDQSQIVDQNYANDILMIVFSTLQTLAARQQSFNLSKQDKIYGYYDRTDYSQKNNIELISQLQIHLLNFQTSKKLFQKKYGPNSYTLPSSFTKADFFEQIDEFKKIFRNNKVIKQMVYDFSNIMANTNNITTYMNKDYDVEYSKEEKKFHRSNMVEIGMKAGNVMRQQKQKVLRGNYHNSSQLPVQIDYSKRGKSSIHGATGKYR